MKVHQPLDELLRGKGTLRVLRALCRRPGSAFSAPDLARSEGLALSHVQGALSHLEGVGVVRRQIAGRSHLWSVVEGNALLLPLRSLFEAERSLENALLTDLASGLRAAPLTRALVFGSFARAEERGWSDLDIFLEISREQDRERVWDALLPLSSRVRERYGVNLAPIVVTRAEIPRALSPSFLANVEREGRSIKEHL